MARPRSESLYAPSQSHLNLVSVFSYCISDKSDVWCVPGGGRGMQARVVHVGPACFVVGAMHFVKDLQLFFFPIKLAWSDVGRQVPNEHPEPELCAC